MKPILLSQTLIFLPIIMAVFIYILSSKLFNHTVFLVQLILSIVVFRLWQLVLIEGRLDFTLGGWSNKISVALKIDALALLFMTMGIIMWWAVLLYDWHNRKSDFKFIFFLMFLEGAFLAFLQANDFFTLFVLLEIITIISAILILYKKDGRAIKAGLYYLLFNSFGMVVYLFGLVLLYLKVGTLNMDWVQTYISESSFSSMDFSVLHVAFVFLFVAMCVKSALLPVHEWLPRAHTAAPASISALLSGLLVKSGLYGLVRLLGIFEVDNLHTFLFYLGFFTAIGGIIFAISQSDIKATLAFSTISQIGLVVMSLSSGTDMGNISAYVHLFNHFLAKSILFFGAGIIINAYGFRRIREIKGIFIAHPLLSISMILSILSMIGAPLTAGFISKNMIKLSLLTQFQTVLFQIVSVGTLLVFLKFSQIFMGEPSKVTKIKFNQLLGTGFLLIILGGAFFFEIPTLKAYFDLPITFYSAMLINAVDYMSKNLYDGSYLINFLGIVVLGCIAYLILIKPNYRFWKSIRHFRIMFQDAIISLMVFIICLLVLV